MRCVVYWTTTAALTAGTLQVAIAMVRRFAFDEFIWVSRDFVWMVPLAYLVVFGACAIPLAALALATPRLIPERAVAFFLMSLAGLAVMLMFPRLHPLAALAVAIGGAVRVTSLLPSADTGERPWVSHWTLLAGTALAVLAGVREVTHRREESTALAELPPARSGAPNVLLIILDTVRAASMSFMGYPRLTTPGIAQLAKEGVTFDHAYTVAPWTLPSHAGIFTGLYPSALSVDWRVPLDERSTTLAEALSSAGYVTAGFAANHFYTSWESGLTRGFAHYEDYRRTWKQVLLSIPPFQTNLFWSIVHDLRPANVFTQLRRFDLRTQTMWTSDRKLASAVTDDFLDWERSRGGRPYFAFLNLYDAHLPYDPPDGWRTKFGGEANDLDRYDGAIAYMDHELDRLVSELRRRNALDGTIMIVTSDHGEGFGEHGLHGHGNSLYRPELHVPLVIRFPGLVPPGRRVDRPVSLRDLGATIFDLTAVSPGSFAGVSLAAAWRSASATVSPVVSEVSAGINTEPSAPVSRGAMRSLVDSTAHYIRNGDGAEELYDFRGDPAEQTDVAATDTARVASMRTAVQRVVGPPLPRR
ncbi:MAG: hypothetical protein MNPFHGCM_02080 [Gemmatimonadaceae bacterium]|nr:hypothetical protein [Gemmatimonadaceae bacterium]